MPVFVQMTPQKQLEGEAPVLVLDLSHSLILHLVSIRSLFPNVGDLGDIFKFS